MPLSSRREEDLPCLPLAHPQTLSTTISGFLGPSIDPKSGLETDTKLDLLAK